MPAAASFIFNMHFFTHVAPFSKLGCPVACLTPSSPPHPAHSPRYPPTSTPNSHLALSPSLLHPSIRERYHPAAFEERLARRKAESAEAAAALIADMDSGRLAPDSDAFNQGALDVTEPLPRAASAAAPGAAGAEGGAHPEEGEQGAAAPQPPPPPSALLWTAGRVAADLRAAMRLAAVLDSEKGVVGNPLLPEAPAGMAAEKGDERGRGRAVMVLSSWLLCWML